MLRCQCIAEACVCLAAKIEEQPRKLSHIITASRMCTHRGQKVDVTSKVCCVLYCCRY